MHYVMNPFKFSIYVFFIFAVRFVGAIKLGSGEDKRCSGLKALKTKVKRGAAN